MVQSSVSNRLSFLFGGLFIFSAALLVSCATSGSHPLTNSPAFSDKSTTRHMRGNVARQFQAVYVPTPNFTAATPYANFVNANSSATFVPYSYTGSNSVSVVASVLCKTSPNGGLIASLNKTAWTLTTGMCDGASNSLNSSGAFFQDRTSNIITGPAYGLVAGQNYLIAGTQNGAALTYYICSPTCYTSSTADAYNLGAGSYGGIGGLGLIGDIWNFQIYNSALSMDQIQTLANSASPDPYIPVPSPSPTVPAPSYAVATPYANYVNANPSASYYPITFTGGNHVTVLASIKCKSNANGGLVGALNKNAWTLSAGMCNAASNSLSSTGAFFQDRSASILSGPSTGLSAGRQYLLAGTQDGSNLIFSLCSPTCTQYSAVDANNLGSGTYGAVSGGIDLFGDIWGFEIFNTPLTAAQIQQVANAAIPDPYPTSTPNSTSTGYTNANPPSEGGALGGTTVGPAYAPDAFHVDWDMFCLNQPSHCSGGNPNYVANDAAMIADTLPSNLYGAGVSSICTGATIINATGNTCDESVGVYYAKTSDLLVTITCTASYGCGAGPSGMSSPAPLLSGSQIYIPSGAEFQPGGDGHMSVKQPSGVICQLYLGGDLNSKVTSTSINVSSGACGPANYTSEGLSGFFDPGGYASNDEMSRGFLRPEDIVGNNFDGTDSVDPYSFYHAMYGGFANNQAGTVFPAFGGDGQCTSADTYNGAMPKEGMYLYLDSAGFSIVEDWNPPIYLRWLKRALGSIHRHGMLDMDSSGCGTSGFYVNTLEWGSQSYVQGGGTSPIDAYLNTYIHPTDSAYANGGGTDDAIYVNTANSNYSFNVLWYEDVPNLSSSNFHWLNLGCGLTAVEPSATQPNPC